MGLEVGICGINRPRLGIAVQKCFFMGNAQNEPVWTPPHAFIDVSIPEKAVAMCEQGLN